MSADYYRAETENGDDMDDPSEDGLFMLLRELNRVGNTFVSITPADSRAGWFASVSLLPNGTYETTPMARGGKHEVFVQTSADEVAHDLTLWLAKRDYSGRPVSSS
jgi:hypothetical protein